MSLINLLITLSLTFLGSMGLGAIAPKRKSLLYSTTILLAIAVSSYSDQIAAFAAIENDNNDNVAASQDIIKQNKQQLQEDLTLSPDGKHYSGTAYAININEEAKVFNDETIEQIIKTQTNNNVMVAVANGSVKLSGKVQDQEVARHIIEQAKTIPGVYEISFDL